MKAQRKYPRINRTREYEVLAKNTAGGAMFQPKDNKDNIVQSTLVQAIEGLSIDLFYIKPNQKMA